MSWRVINSDCRLAVEMLPDSSVHSCVTDPPYALVSIVKRFAKSPRNSKTENVASPYSRTGAGFMGQKWDTGETAFDPEFWADVWRVLKPGGHVLAFGGTRTYHRLTCAIEDAGFEIRDQIGWLYGSGFPKSHNQDGDWAGWGTALKPAWEPIVLARKALAGTVAENVRAHGAGAINIDGCRVEAVGRPHRVSDPKPEANGAVYSGRREAGGGFDGGSKADGTTNLGRWPANIIHDGSDEVLAAFPEAPGQQRPEGPRGKRGGGFADVGAGKGDPFPNGPMYGDSGSAARFFYCAKASKRDREEGLDGFEKKSGMLSETSGQHITRRDEGFEVAKRANNHPTVKPTDLMRYLCRLVTPPGGTVFDPFAGSGSTGKAAILEGFNFIGVEREADYARIAEARIAFAEKQRLEALIR